jgi:hypothetical protein
MTVDQAAQEIEDGFASLRTALGDPKAVSPFFRIPGLLRQNSVEQYLAAHGDMTWSVDFLADDWTHINNKEVARRAISRIEARGKGILLLHDIQPATALAFPEILSELKARGFKIVHVVPATADRPKTVAEPQLWVARRPSEQKIWPRTLVVGAEEPEPVLNAPAPANFGIEHFGGPVIKIALAQTFERQVVRDGDALLPPVATWPRPVAYSVSPQTQVLPAPGAYNFRYSRPFRLGNPDKPKLAAKKPAATAGSKAKDTHTAGGLSSPQPVAPRPRFGHQATVMRPPTKLTLPQTR